MSAELNSIIREILHSELSTTAEVRVYLSRKWFERDVARSARAVFARYGMSRTAQKNAVLIYVNLRRKKFAIVPDEGLASSLTRNYWTELAAGLKDDLLSTRYENAVAMAIRTLGITLAEKFPQEITDRGPSPT